MGSGRTELARCLFGIDTLDSGEVSSPWRAGRPVRPPRRPSRPGLALIPEDRRAQGLVLDHSVRDNLLLPLLKKIERGPLVDDGAGKDAGRRR